MIKIIKIIFTSALAGPLQGACGTLHGKEFEKQWSKIHVTN
jgi:hypothetical protein